MPDLRSQRQLAARIMKCGTTRVWMDPALSADIAEAITSDDVRKLVSDGAIRIMPRRGVSSYRKNWLQSQKKKGRRSGKGARKGAKQTRTPRKKAWISRIRSIRNLIRSLKEDGRIDGKSYRDVYIKSKSGLFRSKSHVMIYLERNNMLKESKSQKHTEAGRK